MANVTRAELGAYLQALGSVVVAEGGNVSLADVVDGSEFRDRLVTNMNEQSGVDRDRGFDLLDECDSAANAIDFVCLEDDEELDEDEEA